MSSCRLDSFAHLTRPLFGVKTFRRPWLSVDSYFSTAPTAPPTHSYSMLGGREERKQENFPDFFPLLLTLTLMAECTILDSAVLSHNLNYSSGSHSLAPGWLRNRVILPPHLTANPIRPPVPSQCNFSAWKYRKQTEKTRKEGPSARI